jgi:hypothetical protein
MTTDEAVEFCSALLKLGATQVSYAHGDHSFSATFAPRVAMPMEIDINKLSDPPKPMTPEEEDEELIP